MVDRNNDTGTDDKGKGNQSTSQKRDDDSSSSTSSKSTQDQGGTRGYTNERTRTSY